MRTILITGGSGSFGNAVLRRFLKTDTFSEIRIFSRDEKKQDDMRQFYRNDHIKYYIGDVRSGRSISYAMQGVVRVSCGSPKAGAVLRETFLMEGEVRTNVMCPENVIGAPWPWMPGWKNLPEHGQNRVSHQ